MYLLLDEKKLNFMFLREDMNKEIKLIKIGIGYIFINKMKIDVVDKF